MKTTNVTITTNTRITAEDLNHIPEVLAEENRSYEAHQKAQDTAFKLSTNYNKQCKIYDYIRGITTALPKMCASKVEKAQIARATFARDMVVKVK